MIASRLYPASLPPQADRSRAPQFGNFADHWPPDEDLSHIPGFFKTPEEEREHWLSICLLSGERAIQEKNWGLARFHFHNLTQNTDRSEGMQAQLNQLASQYLESWPILPPETAEQQGLRKMLRMEGLAFALMGKLVEDNLDLSRWNPHYWVSRRPPARRLFETTSLATEYYLEGLNRLFSGVPELHLVGSIDQLSCPPSRQAIQLVFEEQLNAEESDAAFTALNVMERLLSIWADRSRFEAHRDQLDPLFMAKIPTFQQMALTYGQWAETLCTYLMGEDAPRLRPIRAKLATVRAQLNPKPEDPDQAD